MKILGTLFCFSLAVHAQWSRVPEVSQRDVPSIYVAGNSMYVGLDTVVYISTNGGANWRPTASFANDGNLVDALLEFNGRILVGTGGNGIFMSSNSGTSWHAFSDGLIGLGARQISAFAVRGGIVYAATLGAGVFRLNQSTWSSYGDLPLGTAGSVWSLFTNGDTLIAGAGGNGEVWLASSSTSTFNRVVLGPFTGSEFLTTSILRLGVDLFAGSTQSIYRSTTNGASWEFAGVGVPRGRQVFLTAIRDTLFAMAPASDARFYRRWRKRWC